jgi:hypothetical protein
MQRQLIIAFTLLVCFFAANPWIVIHSCGGATAVRFLPDSAADPCGCTDEDPAARCCTLEMKAFHFDDAPPVVPLITDAPLAGIPVGPALEIVPPVRDGEGSLLLSGFRPPGQPPLIILHCSLLV